MLADGASRGLLGGAMSQAKKAQLKAAREALDRAKALVAHAVPSLAKLVAETVQGGWDGANSGYAGFCIGKSIVVNLAPMVKGLSAGAALPTDAGHELTLTVCHELGHLLERSAGHGEKWRATQDSLVQAVLLHVSGPVVRGASAFAGLAGCQCQSRG